ncbi:MAG: peptide chain release factor N(5)-glutamine methyltransferase [Spirochaetota bacterium]|jgi:release factor glutamine methyltransferase|nr:peptide chain release factor N(5)-glutamine methyltransferase [Spirochaetota bacterium]
MKASDHAVSHAKTVRDALDAGALRLHSAWAAHSPIQETDYNARLDAEVLLAFVLRSGRSDLYAHPERALDAEETEKYQAVLARRAAFEPIAYITGEREFYGLSFAVGPEVLIPRPETELIIDITRAFTITPRRIIDVGTGSGALAICLARIFPEAEVWATEISPDAFAWAKRNAERLLDAGERARCAFVLGDLFAGIEGNFDLIVSNPPYLGTAEYHACMPDVRIYEPAQALIATGCCIPSEATRNAQSGDGASIPFRAQARGTAEDDGLALYRRLINALPKILAPQGRAVFEISDSVLTGVLRLAREAGFSCETRQDLAGHTRIAVLAVSR